MLHSRVLWKVHSKDHPVAVTYINNDTATGCSYTTLLDSTSFSQSCCDRTTVQVSHLYSINKRLTAHRR
jgi:hypothetical protein